MKTKVKVKKLLRKLNRLLDENSHDHLQRAKSLEKVTRKLKRRQKLLEEGLRSADDVNKAGKIKKKLAIVKAMRVKGLRALKEERRAVG